MFSSASIPGSTFFYAQGSRPTCMVHSFACCIVASFVDDAFEVVTGLREAA
jgi:hypothetical protein